MNRQPEPSTKSLLLACFSALLLAVIMLICFILPAEYNIDPTGIGHKLGLTVLAQTDTNNTGALSCIDHFIIPDNEKPVLPNQAQVYHPITPDWQDVVIINIPAKSGLEYKFHLDKDKAIQYHWQSDGTPLYFDFHGEPDGDHSGYFKSYQESSLNQSSGTLTVPFTGKHGWYWENQSAKAVKVLLQTRGEYQVLGLM